LRGGADPDRFQRCFRVGPDVIARVVPSSPLVDNARKQIDVARWLESIGYLAVRAIDVQQPVESLSEIVVAPSATATAISTNTRPGSWRARGLRNPVSALDSSAVSVVRSATSATNRDPACDTTPSPSAVAVIRGRVVMACTLKVLLYSDELGPQQAQSLLVAGHFRLCGHGHAIQLTKSRG
jgi:hypothetical protein